MSMLEPKLGIGPGPLSRLALFSILPAGALGCLACARAAACAQPSQAAPAVHGWTEKADVTWEEMFRFAYQKDLIPLLVEQSPEAFEYRVKKCLWAKVFRDEDAADIGYSMVCYPDYAVVKGLNPKLQLIRTKTLMQGGDSCSLRYVMEA